MSLGRRFTSHPFIHSLAVSINTNLNRFCHLSLLKNLLRKLYCQKNVAWFLHGLPYTLLIHVCDWTKLFVVCEGNTYQHLMAGNSFHGNTLKGNMEFLQWSCHDVARWIESLGFPQYKACFTENLITGRKLIYVNCISLPRLGITDFNDMKVISAHVRELLGITETLWSRSIADPPRDSVGLFLEKKSRTGERADSLTYQQFLDGVRQ